MKADGCGWGVSDVRVIRSCIKIKVGALSFFRSRHSDIIICILRTHGRNDRLSKPTYPRAHQLKTFYMFGHFGEARGRFA